jgi:hypothetical protein
LLQTGEEMMEWFYYALCRDAICLKNTRHNPPTPYIFMALCLDMHRNNFTFYIVNHILST